MYVSPLTERMRKRKAFADNELESNAHLFAMSSVSSVSNLSTPYTSLSMPTATATAVTTVPLNMQLSSVIDYSTIHQTMITSENESTEYLSTSHIGNYQLSTEYPCSESSTSRIRIIDEAKLCNMDGQNNDRLMCSPPTNEHSHYISAKPKLSFSIESIIGIKWRMNDVLTTKIVWFWKPDIWMLFEPKTKHYSNVNVKLF